MWQDSLLEQLKRHEGFVPHAYQDHLGYWTIGYGRLIDRAKGGGVSKVEAERLLINDVNRVVTALRERLPFFESLPERKKQALANMAFQLGVAGLLNFRRMLQAVRNGEWTRAQAEALDSKWARQTPTRAQEIARMLGEPEA
jgi:lysozyme